MQWVSSSNRKVLLRFGSVMYFVVRREGLLLQQVSPPVQEHIVALPGALPGDAFSSVFRPEMEKLR